MPTTLRTRKPIDQLTAKDLEAFSVWEYATDEEGVEGMDETWVKPVATSVVPRDSFCLTVAVAIKIANGTVFPGVLHCSTAPSLTADGIALLTTGGRILLDLNPLFGASELSHLLGLEHDQIFPMQFATRVPLDATGSLAFGNIS